MAPTKVILDVDTGTDDAVALMLAVLHPDLELVAATCVGGNTPVENVVENTLRVFDWLGETRVPVFVGCGQAIARSAPPSEDDPGQTSSIHGDHLDLPVATSAAQPGIHAVDFILNYFADPAGADTVLVATGPLSNLAMALKMRPELATQVKRIVIMGGGHTVCNCTPSAEFNFWQDPEAARVVVNCGADITLVPLDATHAGGVVTLDDCKQLRALGTPAGEAAATFAERRARAYADRQEDPGAWLASNGGAPMHDPLALMSVCEPDVLQNVGKYHVDVETGDGLTVGRSVIDTRGRRPGEPGAETVGRAWVAQLPNCTVALGANPVVFRRVLLATLAKVVPSQTKL